MAVLTLSLLTVFKAITMLFKLSSVYGLPVSVETTGIES